MLHRTYSRSHYRRTRVATDARVRSVPILDVAALTALEQWRYTPALLNGVPVRVLMTVTFRFSLGDRDL